MAFLLGLALVVATVRPLGGRCTGVHGPSGQALGEVLGGLPRAPSTQAFRHASQSIKALMGSGNPSGIAPKIARFWGCVPPNGA
jgi:hypothetical protein